jgi:oxalate---CoA ligase
MRTSTSPSPLDVVRDLAGTSCRVGYAARESTHEADSIGAAISRWAKAAGNAVALAGVGSKEVTFSQLLASIHSFAHHLGCAGVRREDRVGLLVPPGLAGGQLAVALTCNVTLVPINPALTSHELIELVKVSGLNAIVIPRWLHAPARSAVFEQAITVLEAELAPDGELTLEPVGRASEAAGPVRPARDSDIALLLRSSGTTGAPKLIPVTHRNLLAMAQKMGSGLWYKLGPQDRAACTSPLYYNVGLKTSLLVPLILGASVGFPPAGQNFDVAGWLDVLKPTYLSVAPGPLHGIVDRLRASPRGFDGESLRFVMCSSAYLAEELRLAAAEMLRVPVLEYYGMGEAGAVAANPAPPGRNKPGTVGLPLPGELLVVDENCEPVQTGAVGQIMVGGPGVMPGYVKSDASTPDPLRDGWLLTGDLGRLDEDGYLTIVGRMKEVINRGGEKVFPYEVEKTLLEHPAVLEAAAFAVPHARLGEIVGAAAVLKPGITASEEELKVFLAARLAAFKLPRRLQVVTSLPRGATGKILRRSLSQAHSGSRSEMVQPREWLEFELRDLWERLLGTDDIGIDDDFFEIGGDSLLATNMLMEVELLVGKPYPQSELATLTIRRMAEVVASGLVAERTLITQVKTGSRPPLFFCHGDYLYRGLYAQRLAALLPDDQPVFLVHCFPDNSIGSSIEEIASAYLPEVLRAAHGSPVSLGGFCNGGLVAWHLAHLLVAKNVEVKELILIETMSLNARRGLRALARLIAGAGSVVPGRAGRFLRDGAMRAAWIFARTGVTGVTAALGRAGRRLFRKPQNGFAPDSGQDIQRAFKMYYEMVARYVPPRINVDVTCFIAEKGPAFDTEPAFWNRIAKRVLAVTTPGDHHTALISERQTLARAMAKALKCGTARPAGDSGEIGNAS